MASTSVLKQCGPGTARSSWSRWRLGKTAAIATLVCTILLGWVFRRPWFQGNLGIVDPGRVLRSAQPTLPPAQWVHDFPIKSILNLRGGSPADWWYTMEVRTAQDEGVSYYDMPMSATRRPSRRELLRLIDLLERCPYPLLIHCKSGADRTGLASAVYLMVRRGVSPERALDSFSIEFGHIPFFGTEHLHEPLDEYAAWLQTKRLSHTAERFRAWVKQEYRADDPRRRPPPLEPGPRARRTS